MIIRIMGEGQYALDDAIAGQLNELDAQLDRDLDAHADAEFAEHLAGMAELVRTRGTRVPDDEIIPSDALIPPPDISIDELRALVGDDGLVPG